jgi:hypothetical protein
VGAAQGRVRNVDVRWELLYAEVLERAPAAWTIEHAKALEHAPVPHAGGMTEVQMKEGRQTVVICGFGELGQTIANMLEVYITIQHCGRVAPCFGLDARQAGDWWQ